jgi:phosphoglucosamine mutase
MSVRFGTDGVRGRVFDELSPHDALCVGRAAALELGARRIYLARDTRSSGPVLAAAVAAGIASEGVDVVDLGVLPTPALAAAAAADDVAAAMVTASHNPHHDNGIKLFAPGGCKLDTAVEARIEAAISERRPYSGSAPGTIEIAPRNEPADRYVASFDGVLAPGSLAGLHVVLDAANGAMSYVAPRVVAALGAECSVLHAEPDGRNINRSCGATHPDDLSAAVVERGADMGLAFDGDGDRVIAVDHAGRVVDGDRLMALFALDLRERGRLIGNTVVVTVMTNLGFHRAMAAAGIGVRTTPVGDRHVLAALESEGFVLGGEQSGHIVIRSLATTGDGLLAGVLLADLVARSGRPLADIAAEVMVTVPQVLVNVAVDAPVPDIADRIASVIAETSARLGDEGRVLVRPSGTEPLVRVMVEAVDDEIARACADDLAHEVRRVAVSDLR